MTTSHEEPERTALYRLYDGGGQLLYIGITRHPERRWVEHGQRQAWWHLVTRKTVEWHAGRNAALAAEVSATADEKPLYDSSWRRTQAEERVGFNNSGDVSRIAEDLTQKIMSGEYAIGSRLLTVQVAREYGVALATARHAMHELTPPARLLKYVPHGRFEVLPH